MYNAVLKHSLKTSDSGSCPQNVFDTFWEEQNEPEQSKMTSCLHLPTLPSSKAFRDTGRPHQSAANIYVTAEWLGSGQDVV